jgi:hypothetical protein
VVVGFGCSSLPPVSPPPTAGASALPSQELPGDPVVADLDTRRAHVVRLSETGMPTALGRLHLYAPIPGVMAAVDGGQQLALPQNIDLEPGYHQLVATCPDGSTETYRTAIEVAATVHLRVCARPMRP